MDAPRGGKEKYQKGTGVSICICISYASYHVAVRDREDERYRAEEVVNGVVNSDTWLVCRYLTNHYLLPTILCYTCHWSLTNYLYENKKRAFARIS